MRPYQERAVQDLHAAIDRRPILQLPTGGGKTRIAAELIRRHGRPALFVAHRREIILQSARALEAAGLVCGVVMSGTDPTPGAPVQVASIQTLARREWPAADLCVIDECHHAAPGSQYEALFSSYPRLVGLTATPFRLDGTGLGAVGFREIVVGATAVELCAERYLVEPEIYAPVTPDLQDIEKVGGDFHLGQLSRRMSMDEIVGGVVEQWMKHAQGRRTVLFAVSIAHSVELCARFEAAGVKAEHVDAGTPKPERDAVLRRLARGETTVLCNVGILSEGWDLPSLEVAILARPTLSECLHRQQIGRIMRACPEKTGAIVLDHAGNTLRHGRVTDEIEADLEGLREKGDPDLKVCPMCGVVVDDVDDVCPGCGFAWGKGGGRPRHVREVEGDLESDGRVVHVTFEDRAVFFNRVVLFAFRRGADAAKAAATAAAAHKRRYGFWPCAVGTRLVDPAAATDEDWRALREGWAALMRKKGKPPSTQRWFAEKCEREARTRAEVEAALAEAS
jgi:superfamily II DNA or RNA helicase